MNQFGFADVLRILFNCFAAVSLAAVMLLASIGGGPWETGAFFIMFLYLFSLPSGALVFAVMPKDFLEVVLNPYARAFLWWAPFFVLGWVQWALVIPAVWAGAKRVKGAISRYAT